MKPEATIVCILGMHRSGTSLVARAANLLGLYLGPREQMMKPSKFNPTGFWENRRLTALNDRILKRLGGGWLEPPPLDPDFQTGSDMKGVRKSVKDYLEQHFAQADLWGWKDPRTCLTLPFWQSLLPKMRYVICLRNPVDVAKSLEHSIPFRQGIDLWLTYAGHALTGTSGEARLLLFYEDVLEDPTRAARELSRFMRNAEVEPDPQALEAIHAFVDEKLHHHRSSTFDALNDPRIPLPAKALHLALRQYARLDAPASTGRDSLGESIDALAAGCIESKADMQRLEAALEADAGQEESLGREARTARYWESLQRDVRRIRRRQAEELARMRRSFRRTLQRMREELKSDRERAAADIADAMRNRLHKTHQTPGFGEGWARQNGPGSGEPAALGRERVRGGLAQASGRLGGSVRSSPQPRPYADLRARIRELVQEATPPDSKVLMVNKGDEKLLAIPGRTGWHFPRARDGAYAGFYPENSAKAIEHLEELRKAGAQFIVFPKPAFWWLTHYAGFHRHLQERGRPIAEEEAAVIFALDKGVRQSAAAAVHPRQAQLRQICEILRSMLPESAQPLLIEESGTRFVDFQKDSDWGLNGAGVEEGEAVDAGQAVFEVEEGIRAGADFLVVPSQAFWWLNDRQALRSFLETRCELVTHQRRLCTVYAVRRGASESIHADAAEL